MNYWQAAAIYVCLWPNVDDRPLLFFASLAFFVIGSPLIRGDRT